MEPGRTSSLLNSRLNIFVTVLTRGNDAAVVDTLADEPCFDERLPPAVKCIPLASSSPYNYLLKKYTYIMKCFLESIGINFNSYIQYYMLYKILIKAYFITSSTISIISFFFFFVLHENNYKIIMQVFN